jgi:hypothetical protein
MSISKRAFCALTLESVRNPSLPVCVGIVPLQPPETRQYILRMMIARDGECALLPPHLYWTKPMLHAAEAMQAGMGLRQPFCYITVRHGIVTSQTDDEWHVDGFSTRITHLPEQNYIWCSDRGTEFADQTFSIPNDFDPLVHNLNSMVGPQVRRSCVTALAANTVWLLDPSIVHRRPGDTTGTQRTFVRISFVPIEILDDSHTPNPLLPCREYRRNGVASRNTLSTYGA